MGIRMRGLASVVVDGVSNVMATFTHLSENLRVASNIEKKHKD